MAMEIGDHSGDTDGLTLIILQNISWTHHVLYLYLAKIIQVTLDLMNIYQLKYKNHDVLLPLMCNFYSYLVI